VGVRRTNPKAAHCRSLVRQSETIDFAVFFEKMNKLIGAWKKRCLSFTLDVVPDGGNAKVEIKVCNVNFRIAWLVSHFALMKHLGLSPGSIV
jgi:hypothetical protein